MNDPAGTGGQYWLVMNGSLVWNGAEYGPWSLLFVERDGPALAATAGERGLEVLHLQYARTPSTTPRARAA